MTEEIDRQAAFISKLVRLSQEGKIDWKLHERGGFVGRVLGRDVRIFETDRPPGTAAFRRGFKMPVLELLVEDGKVGYAMEDRAGLDGLLASAAYQAARVDSFMADVLAS